MTDGKSDMMNKTKSNETKEPRKEGRSEETKEKQKDGKGKEGKRNE